MNYKKPNVKKSKSGHYFRYIKNWTFYILLLLYNFLTAQKYDPGNGKTIMIIGQTWQQEYEGYINATKIPPAGSSHYGTIYSGTIEQGTDGINNVFLNWVDNNYSGAYALVALSFKDNPGAGGYSNTLQGVRAVANGQHDQAIDRYANIFKSKPNMKFFLRIGYEVSPGVFQDAAAYKQAYNYVANRLRNINNVTNVAFVYHPVRFFAEVEQMYPGDEFVDWVALSVFNNDLCLEVSNIYNCQGNAVDSDIARVIQWSKNTLKKPVMFAEAAVQPPYSNSDNGFNTYVNKLFDVINQYDVDAVAYINSNWTTHGWDSQYWGDSRIESRNSVFNNWMNKIQTNRFVHHNNDTPQPPTCSDGIQNGNETGIDCGGSCPTCDNPPPPPSGDTLKIEAESGTPSGSARYYNDGAASNGRGVAYLDQVGNGITFENVPASTEIELTYASQNTGRISVLVNGSDEGDINFNSNNSWVGNYTTTSKSLNIPANSTLQIIHQSGDLALNIDYIRLSTTSSDDPDPQPCTGNDIPNAEVSKTDESSDGANDGSITFSFEDDANTGGSRTNLEFSIDNGNTYPYAVADNQGSTTINNLAPNSYQLWVRWGNDECPRSLGTIEILPASSSPNCNDGIHNGNETGVDCGGDCAPCTPPTTSDCGDFGLTIVNGQGIIYYKEALANLFYLCLNGACYPADEQSDGYYKRFVDVTEGQNYTILAQTQNGNLQEQVTATADCNFDNTGKTPNLDNISDLMVYPNPAKTTIQIINGPTSLPVKIYTITGKEIFTAIYKANTNINISDYTPGIYFVKSGTSSIKLIIQ